MSRKQITDFLVSSPDRAVYFLLAASVSAVILGIAAAEILLAMAMAGAVWLWRRGGIRSRLRSSGLLPLALFAAWGFVTAFAAGASLGDALHGNKKAFLYAILFFVPFAASRIGDLVGTYRSIFLFSAISACAGLIQFALNPHRDWLHRISGFMSIWMTYAGLLMLVLVALAAYAICLRKDRPWRWILPLGLIIAAALLLSETRNAWYGSIAGIGAVLLLGRRFGATAGLVLLLFGIYLGSPESIKQRVRSSWDLEDDNTRNRLELFGTSLRMIRANPWLGVGPENVSHEALKYRGTQEFPDWMYQHMHNNILQIAAERGIPGLVLWLWFMLGLAWDAFKVLRSSQRESPGGASGPEWMISTAALGGWVALLVAGLFEYNFGDSEVLFLFLFMTAAPAAVLAAREGAARIRAASSIEAQK